MFDKNAFFAAPVLEKHTVPGCGDLYLRPMSGDELVDYTEWAGPKEKRHQGFALLVFGCRTVNDEPVFTRDEVGKFGKAAGDKLWPVVKRLQVMNGFLTSEQAGDEKTEEAAKK